MLRRLPTSTLFPYTTLFRSSHQTGRVRAVDPVALRQRLKIARRCQQLRGHRVVARRPSELRMFVQERLHDLNRSEEHTSELQSPYDLVCRLLLEKKK